MAKGRIAEGLAHWRKVLQKSPDNPRLLSDTAWVLATSREDAVRNGNEAVEIAEHAVQLTGERDATALATLAAAYAETGEFAKAIDADQRAIQLAAQQGKSPMAEAFRARLARFQANRPLRK